MYAVVLHALHVVLFSFLFALCLFCSVQGEAIAHNLRTMFSLKVPIISVVTGGGGSGEPLPLLVPINCLCLRTQLSMLQGDNSSFYFLLPSLTNTTCKLVNHGIVSKTCI